MSPTELSRETADELDMAKLQKSLKQQQRHSRPQVKKLTPAEIRSLNHEAAVSKQRSSTGQQKTPRRANGPPIIVPGNDRNRTLPRPSTAPLPTPPRSPVRKDRRTSKRDQHERSHATTNFSTAHERSSRASSVSSQQSSRSLQMYRGREVTQTGNPSMLRHPQQEIVTNPLSMFSRPRQSQLQASTSPDKFKRDFMELDPYQAQAMLDDDGDDGSRQTGSPRVMESPVSMEDSPLAGEKVASTPREEDEDSTVVERSAPSSLLPKDSSDNPLQPAKTPTPTTSDTTNADEPSQPRNKELPEADIPSAKSYTQTCREQTNKVMPSPELPQLKSENESVPATSPESNRATAEPDVPPNVVDTPERSATASNFVEPKDAKKKRFTFHQIFDKKDVEKKSEQPKKQRRRTLSFTKTPESSPIPPAKPFDRALEAKETPRIEPQSPSHPAVRPLSSTTETPPSTKAPEPDDETPVTVPSVPTYGRCACCGKVRKPGYSSDLSPVMENENLRTNFSLEADRVSHENHRKYTAIIPMPVQDRSDAGSVRTVQATIEPKSIRSSASSIITPRTSTDTRHADSSSIISAVPEASRDPSIRETTTKPSKRHTLDEPKIVRFASLKGRRGSESDVASALEEQDAEEEIVQSVPFLQPIVQPIVQPPRPVLGPSEHELSRQRQLQFKPVPKMSSTVPRAPHPLRQSSPIDQLVEELHAEHGTSIGEAQQQQVKRVPKQDIITVVPLKRQSGSSDASPLTTSPQKPLSSAVDSGAIAVSRADATDPATGDPKAENFHTEPVTVKDSPPLGNGPNKLVKQQTMEYPPSSFPTTGKKARRLSLPLGFRLPNSRRASTSTATTFSNPYSASEAGTPPETDLTHKPALPSQTSTARTSFASAVSEQLDRAGRAQDRRRSSSNTPSFRERFRSASREPADPVGKEVATGDAARAAYESAIATAGAKSIRPSPSFNKFISNLPASHPKDLPEPRRLFGMGTRRRSLQQQQPPTIAENVSNTPKIALNGETLRKGSSGATNGYQTIPTPGHAQMTQSMSLPILKLGEQGDGWASSGTLRALMSNGGGSGGAKDLQNGTFSGPNKDHDMELTASPIEIRDAINGTGGGFVGGRKLEMLLRRDKVLSEVAHV